MKPKHCVVTGVGAKRQAVGQLGQRLVGRQREVHDRWRILPMFDDEIHEVLEGSHRAAKVSARAHQGSLHLEEADGHGVFVATVVALGDLGNARDEVLDLSSDGGQLSHVGVHGSTLA